MNEAYISAISVLAGSSLSGLIYFVTTKLSLRVKSRELRIAADRKRREELYRNFIDHAARLYAHALTHIEAEVSQLFDLYTMINWMRVHSSTSIVEQAEVIVRMIVETYAAPNKTFSEVQVMMEGDASDPLRIFSEACREELR